MAAIHSSNRPTDAPSMRSRADGEVGRPLSRNDISLRSLEENRAPPAIPKAFESMLKTTTETGDIGLFSIKPPRVPQPLNSPRKIGGAYRDNPQQKPRSFHPYVSTAVDDRRRLPSYARDAASEVISMYETASQKSSSPMFDDPDYRSYSMTQTYSTYSLSNHRSYASLRSQPEGSTLLQRPRSPFAYPTRLKRPGFRPSSPALTDGGVVDYSRRAEIERSPYDDRRATSSPASLYAQKRRLPPSLRPDANRSTPSLLSQPSPVRRSPSPHMRQGNGTPTIDWQRRHGPASVRTSPARSTLSLSSTANIHQAAPPLSATTTPGHIPPPSPLYYDYTEDFDIDDYNQPEALDPPPQFRIEKTIPEDRPLSSGWQSNGASDEFSLKRGFAHNRQASNSTPSKAQRLPQGSRDSFSSTTKSGKIFEAVDSGSSDTELVNDTLTDQPDTGSRDKKVIRLSRLGLGAQELNSHVEEAFGLIPSPSFEILIPGEHESRNPLRGSQLPSNDGHNSYEADGVDGERGLPSARVSSYSLNSHLRQNPPTLDANTLGTDFTLSTDTGTAGAGIGNSETVQSGTVRIYPSQSQGFAASLPKKRETIFPIAQGSSSPEGEQGILRHATSNASNIADIDQLLLSLSQSGGFGRDYNNQPTHGVRHTNVKSKPELSACSSLHGISPRHHMKSPMSSNRHLGNDEIRHGLYQQSKEWNKLRIGGRRLEAATISSYEETDVPNFSHQIPRKLMSRSESPMLAPKPISPARQLKLKNSVPQLMKALPPLPPEQLVRTVSPPSKLGSLEELPCRFSPLLPATRSSQPEETGEPYTKHCLGPVVVPTLPPSFDLSLVDNALKTSEDGHKTSSPPKLKLKLRSSRALRPTSSSDAGPRMLEERYLFPGDNPNLGPSPVVQDNKPGHPKPPKFKLKITRASSSTLGTVRINRESSSDSKFSAGLHLPSPKDLFTPNIGIDGIFRQVSRHIHSRRESLYSNHISPPDSPVSSAPDQTTEKHILKADPNDAQASSASSTGPGSLPDGRSYFSDDSSNIFGRHNLRKRFTNLRARISIPYKSRIGSQSFDDIAWRNRNETLQPSPAARSHLHLPTTGMGVEVRPTRRLTEKFRAQQLRLKVSKWFKGARSAIASRVKSRTGTSRSGEE